MVIKKNLLLVAVLALAPFMVSTNAFADDVTSNVQLATLTTSTYNINGVEVRLAKAGEGKYINYDNNSRDFRGAALNLAKMAKVAGVDMDVNKVLRLNGWTKVANEPVPIKVGFWVHPELDPQNLFASN